ncbi:hypothetical protein Dsin_032176 [Dipteronia sinensis]|uniref:DUF4283 domain-containing protein n=1 Tax=Dipteronia sinensis TaxID=43782 RepID=A0AAD9ZNT0_9ROSI|nr:hypothetical protein Dsin_032176 [Dipteronia sinensis]
MKLSSDLKVQLCKPWSNALILKIMRRPHTLNFIGQWQLRDLEDGYFVVRFQMQEDLDFVLTGGPWVIANQYLVVQMWRPNFVPSEDEIRQMPIWSKAARMPDVGRESNVVGNDSFGPWMQVSYGRNGSNNDGTRNFGRRNRSVGNSGGVSSGSKSNNRPPANELWSKVQWSNQPKNYLGVNKSGFCKPFEENVNKIGLSSSGKLKSNEKQQEHMEEILEDFEVLKALHQKMMDSVQPENVTGDDSMDANVDIILDENDDDG